MKKRLLVWALGIISAGLALLSIFLFNAARGLAGGANDELAETAKTIALSEKMMIVAALFGVLAAVVGLFKGRGGVGGLR